MPEPASLMPRAISPPVAPVFPGFVGVLDKAVKRIVEIARQAGGHRARRCVHYQRSVLRRRHAPQRQHPDDAGVRRREAAGVDGQHRALERCGRHGAGLDLDGREGDLPGGLAPAGSEVDLARRAAALGHRYHDGQHPPAEVSPGRSVGRSRRRAYWREAHRGHRAQVWRPTLSRRR